jgi:hypothetical protein
MLDVTGGVSSGIASSLIVRDSETGSLVGDFPLPSIRKVEVLTGVVVKLHTVNGARIAIRFEHQSDFGAVFRVLNDNQVPCSDVEAPSHIQSNESGGIIPDLSDPAVQELALKLLFREDFQQFCQDLSELLDGFKTRMA